MRYDVAHLSHNLTRLRKERDIDLWELARYLGMSRTIVCDYCTGKRLLKLETMVKICEAIGVTPNDLLGDGR